MITWQIRVRYFERNKETGLSFMGLQRVLGKLKRKHLQNIAIIDIEAVVTKEIED